MKRAILLLILTGLLLLSTSATAQTGGGYDLTWNTLEGASYISSGSYIFAGGTIGQMEAGTRMTGGGYTLDGGFWVGGMVNYHVMLPFIQR